MRVTRPPLTWEQLWQDDCKSALSVRDVASVSEMPISTVLYDLRHGHLQGQKRPGGITAKWRINRDVAREYALRMTGRQKPHAA